MPDDTAVIVSDVHLGEARDPAAASFHAFLERVPDLGTHLLINGDLFDFWFEYRSVIPRRAFRTLSALHRLRGRGVRLTVTGGNHDRWGGDFWRRELEAEFHEEGTTLALAGFTARVTHGDGLAERHLLARIMHRVTRWPVTAWGFRWLHPDVGIRLVHAMSGKLADHTRDAAVLDQIAADQERAARHYLTGHADVDLLVLGHTHRPALVAVEDRRWYMNPGAWLDERRYGIVSSAGPSLHQADR